MDPKSNITKQQIIETVRFYQGIALDTVENAYGETPDWMEVRRRLLRAFGDKGLSTRLIQILVDSGVL